MTALSLVRPASLLLALLCALLLGGCATQQHSRDLLAKTLFDYDGAIRWGRFDVAAGFVDPQVLVKRPITPLAMQRYEQVQVTGYKVLGSEAPAEGQLLQSVEIRLVNRHTQTERTIVDQQRWRYDAEQRRWWLSTGLPDITDAR